MRTLLVVLLVLGLAACSDDDSNGKTDSAVPDASPGIEASVLESGVDQAIDQNVAADQQVAVADQQVAVADQQVADEAGTTPDLGDLQSAILTATHTGWQVVNCAAAGCHTLPVDQAAYHADATIGSCADCHGGNGACEAPPGHSQAMSCGVGSSCHAGVHNVQLPKPSACISCHYAAAGTASCN